jgi:hypothetical protein
MENHWKAISHEADADTLTSAAVRDERIANIVECEN